MFRKGPPLTRCSSPGVSRTRIGELSRQYKRYRLSVCRRAPGSPRSRTERLITSRPGPRRGVADTPTVASGVGPPTARAGPLGLPPQSGRGRGPRCPPPRPRPRRIARTNADGDGDPPQLAERGDGLQRRDPGRDGMPEGLPRGASAGHARRRDRDHGRLPRRDLRPDPRPRGWLHPRVQAEGLGAARGAGPAPARARADRGHPQARRGAGAVQRSRRVVRQSRERRRHTGS